MGDDIEFDCFDQDPGKDEEIGHGDAKISAFCCQEEWDEWFEVERKGKRWGKIHLKTKWMPKESNKPKEEEDSGMEGIQAAIKELASKKRELTTELNDARDRIEENEKKAEVRLAGAKAAQAGDDSVWDAQIAEIEQRCTDTHA